MFLATVAKDIYIYISILETTMMLIYENMVKNRKHSSRKQNLPCCCDITGHIVIIFKYLVFIAMVAKDIYSILATMVIMKSETIIESIPIENICILM